MQLFFTIVYIRITTLTWIFHDHPLVEYPLLTNKDIIVKGGIPLKDDRETSMLD